MLVKVLRETAAKSTEKSVFKRTGTDLIFSFARPYLALMAAIDPPNAQDDPHLQRLLDALPRRVRHAYAWLIRPQARWVRWPLAIALMIGGVFGFLPILGFWMVPVGALLIGEDIPPVRRAMLRMLGQLYRWWDGWRSARR